MLFFLEIGSRRVHYAGCTRHPTTAWVVQQARNLAWKLQAQGLGLKFLLRDRDAKFPAAFDAVFRGEGMQIIRLPYRAPRANAFAERWVGTVRREALDHLLMCFTNMSITTSGHDRTRDLASWYQAKVSWLESSDPDGSSDETVWAA